jgi:hypothetical protein
MAVCPGLRLRPEGLLTKGTIRSKEVTEEYDIQGMAEKIRTLRQKATELKEMAGGIQAVDRNVDRILANVKMLELNVVDLVDIFGK